MSKTPVSTTSYMRWRQVAIWTPTQRREALFSLLASKGIAYDDLTPSDWGELFEKYDLLLKGYEFGSKTGISISSFYGTDAHAKEQKWSRVKKNP